MVRWGWRKTARARRRGLSKPTVQTRKGRASVRAMGLMGILRAIAMGRATRKERTAEERREKFTANKLGPQPVTHPAVSADVARHALAHDAVDIRDAASREDDDRLEGRVVAQAPGYGHDVCLDERLVVLPKMRYSASQSL
jgi:hypothetical protein